LSDLSLRKQKQLLETEMTGCPRVFPFYREIASSLCEVSESFCSHQINNEPFVALMSEAALLGPRESDEWLRAFLDKAIADRVSPLWPYGREGLLPLHMISKHRPFAMEDLLQPYLTHPDPFARLWGTACAEAWGGAQGLNQMLDGVAHDTDEVTEVRKQAIYGIAATHDRDAVPRLFDLLEDRDDTVRGAAIKVYREMENPCQHRYFALLKGGSRQRNVTGLLHAEVCNFIDLLEPSQLPEALLAVDANFEPLSDLTYLILSHLFDRAIGHQLREIPADLLIKCWTKTEYLSERHKKFLIKLLRENQALFDETWNRALSLLADKDWYYHQNVLSGNLARCCSDHIFDVLPHPDGLNDYQQWFVSDVLSIFFHDDPSPERLSVFKYRAPVFAQHLQMPSSPDKSTEQGPEASIPEPEEINRKLQDALQQDADDAMKTGSAILQAIFEIKEAPNRMQPSEQVVIDILDRAAESIRSSVLEVLRECVAQKRFECTKDGSVISQTRSIFEDIFWTLNHYGRDFDAGKMSEVIACYAFHDSKKNARYEELLEELRKTDRGAWEMCIVRILEDGIAYISNPIQYLIDKRQNIYVSRCGERLMRGGFSDDFFSYFYEFRPDNYVEVLRECYLTMKRAREKLGQPQPDQAVDGESSALVEWLSTPQQVREMFPTFGEFRPLLHLMAEDDEWAWTEFSERLVHDNVPIEAERPTEFFGGLFRGFKIRTLRLPIFADWYALVRRAGEQSWGSLTLAKEILEVMVLSDSQRTIRELRRLQTDDAFPASRFLSSAILKIEDDVLSAEMPSWNAGQLLDFLNKERFGVVNEERDLFLWVCQAIEDLKDAMEKRAESVAGFWNGDEPKTEPECQNVLWPLLRSKMAEHNIAVTLGEELSIGANWCDFGVDCPRTGAEPFRLRVELKTARHGYSRTRIVEPIENQLWDKYLSPSNCQHGIYIVLWFRNEAYPYPTEWTTPKELTAELKMKCKDVEAKVGYGLSLTSYVIDLTTHPRGFGNSFDNEKRRRTRSDQPATALK